MKRKKRRRYEIILMIQHTPSRNLGSKALFYAMVELMNTAFKPEKLVVWSWFPKYDKVLSTLPKNVEVLPSPARSFTHKLEVLKIVVDTILMFFWAILYKLTKKDVGKFLFSNDKRKLIHYLKTANVVIARGGDGVLTDFYGTMAFFASFYNFLLPIILNKKIVIPSVTIPAFKKDATKTLASFVLKHVDHVIARDVHTANYLKEMGVDESKITFQIDAGFTLSTEKRELPKIFNRAKGKVVGIVPSAYAYVHLKEPRRGKYDKYIKLFAKTIDYIIEKHNAWVLLIPHEFSPYESKRIDDKKVALDILKKLKYKNEVEIFQDYDPRKIKFIISKLDLLISPRMHPLIHALSLGIPIIGIDYGSKKITELMKIWKLENFVIEINALDAETLKEKIDRLIPHLNQTSKHIIELGKILVNRRRYISILQKCAS